MNLYAFELGREKGLCFTELIYVLGKENLVDKNFDTAIFQLADQDFKQLQDRLGGTIKIIKIKQRFSSPTPSSEEINSCIEQILKEKFTDHVGKVPFSVSLLSYKKSQQIDIKKLLNNCKKFLKSLGLNSRFVNKNFENTKPSTIYKAKVIEKGIDICLIQSKTELFVGQSISIQDIDSYSKRDYEKPMRDARVGMLPPKLAQIMINLAGPAQTIYDPFCGTGTILMEGLLQNKSVVGSDNDPRMIEFTEKNCQWLSEEFNTTSNFRAFESDARFITKKKLPEKIDAVITEGYLGRPFSREPNPKQIETSFRELANLHFNWLRNINPFMEKNSKIVMCVTAYNTKKGLVHLPRFDEIATENGFNIEKMHIYGRSNQFVMRDIAVLIKK